MIQAGAPWGVALLKRVHVSQQYALAAKTDDSIMGYIKRITARRQKEEIIVLYSALFRPYPEYSIQF